MTSIEEQLDSYFSSLNPITKRIWNERENIKNAFGEEEWKKLSVMEQEDLLARYMIDEEVRQKYADMEKEPTPELFHKMKINCGEKMVVDLDNYDDRFNSFVAIAGSCFWVSPVNCQQNAKRRTVNRIKQLRQSYTLLVPDPLKVVTLGTFLNSGGTTDVVHRLFTWDVADVAMAQAVLA